MAGKSSSKKRSREDSSDSETGKSPTKQDPSQSETPTGIKGRKKRTKPGPRPKSTRGKKPVRKQTREVSLRRNPVKSRVFLSSAGSACSTRSIQEHVERLNQFNTERKVKILLKDLKKADEKNPQNATKWLQVFCDQITVEGCEDAESLVPEVVRTWMLQRPDLFDFLTVERLVRYCNSENLPYLPVDDELDSEEEMSEEASIPDIDEEQSQNAPSEAENDGNSTDYHALHMETDNDPYAAGPSNRLRPIPSHLQIAMQSGLNLENGELNGHHNDQIVEGGSDSDSEETWHSTDENSGIMGLEVGDQDTPELEFETKDLKMEIDSDSDTPTVMLGKNLDRH